MNKFLLTFWIKVKMHFQKNNIFNYLGVIILLFLFSCNSTPKEKVYTNDDFSEVPHTTQNAVHPTFKQFFIIDNNTQFNVSNNGTTPDSVVIEKLDGKKTVVSVLKSEIEGKIKKVFLPDLDNNKWGEVIVWTKTNHNYGLLYTWEYHDDSPKEVKFDNLLGVNSQTYKGNDSFYCTEKNLIRVIKDSLGNNRQTIKYQFKNLKWLEAK